MVRRSFTAVLEKNAVFAANFETEPYEAGWASEARWFVRVVELQGSGGSLAVTPQISPDGLHWCDEGTANLRIEGTGLHSLALRGFGQWLRLRAALQAPATRVTVMIYLVLKE